MLKNPKKLNLKKTKWHLVDGDPIVLITENLKILK